MSKCARVGHGWIVKREFGKSMEEQCKDCGFIAVFQQGDTSAEYNKAHRRDWIQPSDKEAWNEAYPDKKIITDPQRQTEMLGLLNEKMGKKRLPKVATEYLISFGPHELLQWHLGV